MTAFLTAMAAAAAPGMPRWYGAVTDSGRQEIM